MIMIDPIFKLELLKEYIDWRVENHPVNNGQYIHSFRRWIRSKKQKYNINSPECKRILATHCYYCDRPLNTAFKNNGGKKPSIDHFKPLSKRDNFEAMNMIRVICCQNCNSRKTDIHPAEYARTLTLCVMEGVPFKRYTLWETKTVSQRVNGIISDLMNGNHKLCYYTRKGNYLPKNFIEI